LNLSQLCVDIISELSSTNQSTLFYGKVTASDVVQIERKLLQNMEKILVKKRKLALAERERRGGSGQQENWWGRIRNAASSASRHPLTPSYGFLSFLFSVRLFSCPSFPSFFRRCLEQDV